MLTAVALMLSQHWVDGVLLLLRVSFAFQGWCEGLCSILKIHSKASPQPASETVLLASRPGGTPETGINLPCYPGQINGKQQTLNIPSVL